MIHDDHPGLASFVFCPRCATRLDAAHVHGTERLVCPACRWIDFTDPKLVVAVIAHRDGRVLLHRRRQNPGAGRWTFPSGFVDAGEALESAAAREALEEVNALISVERLVGLYSRDGDRIVLAVYSALVLNDDVGINDGEADAVEWFDPASLPPMAFERDAAIIVAWANGD